MSSEWQEYVRDPRIICKYGAKCYQKNSDHHETYKHPPQLKAKAKIDRTHKRYKPYNRNDTDTKKIQTDEKSHEDNSGLASINIFDTNHSNITRLIQQDNVTYFSKETDNKIYKECFQVEMPNDFFKFFECLNEESSSVEHLMASVNLEMIGPFDLLLGKLPKLEEKDLYLIHWRFFYDVPEFQVMFLKNCYILNICILNLKIR